MALSLARLEAHYFSHNCFLEDGFILKNIHRIRHLPAIIVQGRHDVICPPHRAFELAEAWDLAELKIVDDAGHSALETGILASLLSALNRMASLISR